MYLHGLKERVGIWLSKTFLKLNLENILPSSYIVLLTSSVVTTVLLSVLLVGAPCRTYACLPPQVSAFRTRLPDQGLVMCWPAPPFLLMYTF